MGRRFQGALGLAAGICMSVFAGAQEAPPAASEPDDAALWQAWSRLTPEKQRDAVDWWSLEVRSSASFQVRCADAVFKAAERDPGLWPEAPERPFFDPAEHAPAQPIPRRRLASEAPQVAELVARVERTRPPGRLRRAYTYDWSSGLILRHADVDDPERLFANALAGFPPDADLVEAQVLQALDTGEERLVLAAFEHAYTDREGGIYPLSLYEAWSSGAEIEMPDVDTLGLAHTALGEKRRWVAPVPASKQRSLYDAIGKAFAKARRYRGLREALAGAYLAAEPTLWDGYGEALPRFHALWNRHSSWPPALAKELPRDKDGWSDFLEELAAECGRDKEFYEAGLVRQRALAADALAVRATLARVLRELGAFERASPAPKDGR